MQVSCPSCGTVIPADDLNISTDLALCRACGKTFRLSENIDDLTSSGPDLAAPPAGVEYEPLADGFRISAATRSWTALFIVPFTCVWSGISLSGIYGKQLTSGQFVLSASLFGLPFLIGSCFLISWCAMLVAGKVIVTRRADTLSVFTGLAGIGWTRTYAWSDFSSAREDTGNRFSSWRNRSARTIVLEGRRRASFGSLLSDARRYFVLCTLRAELRRNRRSLSSPVAASRFR
jgi:hypothetical protein